ncbi:MFS transporter [Ramlibacter sp. G-1-2-2]|uniref:MFS transporter n=1 Tax=Ramlibacter agri TaxID=2728837 RepID=A0A848H5K1_9BURK|nr:MFS transporter [Ramlibacter agri]NML44540.1 MFS transporter [Ramlibacter agri]
MPAEGVASATPPWWRLAAPLPTLILVNLTSHLALSGGRLSGSLYTLRSGAGELWAGVFMGLFAFIPLCTSLRSGRWIDRVGARRVMQRGTLLVLAGAWLPVLWLSVPSLFAMALLVGIGYNLVSMAGLHAAASAGDAASSRQRLANFGWLGLGFATSATLGPALAGVLIDAFGFRVALLVTAACTLVTLLLVFTRLGQTVPEPQELPQPRRSEVAVRGLFDLLRRPRLRQLLLVGLTISASWDLFVIMLPVVGTRLGFSASLVGTISSAFALGIFISRALTPTLAVRFPEWHNVRASLVGIVAMFVLLPLVRAPALFIVLALLLGVSIGLSQPNILSLLHAATPRSRSGEALGLRYFLGNCSSVLMPLFFGSAIGVLGVLPIFWLNAGVAGAGLASAQQAVRRVR